MDLLQQIRGVIAEACERYPNDLEAAKAIKRSAAFFGGGGRWDSPNPHIQAARLIRATDEVYRKLTNRGEFFWFEEWMAEA